MAWVEMDKFSSSGTCFHNCDEVYSQTTYIEEYQDGVPINSCENLNLGL